MQITSSISPSKTVDVREENIPPSFIIFEHFLRKIGGKVRRKFEDHGPDLHKSQCEMPIQIAKDAHPSLKF